MMKPLFTAVIAAGGLVAASAAHADGVSFSYVELGYLSIGNDGPSPEADDEGDGFNLDAAGELGLGAISLLGTLELDFLNFDAGGSDIIAGSLMLGAGYDIGTDDNPTMVFGGLSYEDVNDDDDSANDLSGFAVQAGVRSKLSANFEVHARAKYFSFEDDVEDKALRVGATYRVWGPISVNAEYETLQDSDRNSIQAGVRYTYR